MYSPSSSLLFVPLYLSSSSLYPASEMECSAWASSPCRRRKQAMVLGLETTTGCCDFPPALALGFAFAFLRGVLGGMVRPRVRV